MPSYLQGQMWEFIGKGKTDHKTVLKIFESSFHKIQTMSCARMSLKWHISRRKLTNVAFSSRDYFFLCFTYDTSTLVRGGLDGGADTFFLGFDTLPTQRVPLYYFEISNFG